MFIYEYNNNIYKRALKEGRFKSSFFLYVFLFVPKKKEFGKWLKGVGAFCSQN